jgi:hypothetical protein
MEEVPTAEVEAEGGLRDEETAVASALRPVAMVGGPVLRTALLEVGVSLPGAFLSPAFLLLP